MGLFFARQFANLFIVSALRTSYALGKLFLRDTIVVLKPEQFISASDHLSATQAVKHISDLGNQHSDGPHQDQIFNNPAALCLVLWAKKQKGFNSRKGTHAPSRLFMKGVELAFPFLSVFSRLYCV